MNDICNNLNDFIKLERLRLGKKQSELAHAAGLSQSILSRIEKGHIKKPTIETLDKLAKAFGVTLSNLLNLTQKRPPDPVNFHPLTVAVANSVYTELSQEDLQCLIDVQKLLRRPMTVTLVNELLEARKKDVGIDG